MTEDNQPRIDDASFMDLALEQARDAERMGEVPVGAVLTLGGVVLGSGANAQVSTRDPTAHAEIRAIREAATRSGNYRLPGSTLYVTLEPCAMCAAAMVHARIARLVYAANDPKTGAAGSLYNIPQDERLNHRIDVCPGIRAAEASRLLQDFFRARR